MRIRHFLLVLAVLCAVTSSAQQKFQNYPFDSTKGYLIKLADGTELAGSVIEKNDSGIVMRTASVPRLEIPYESIKQVEELPSANMKRGEFWFPNPHPTRYLYSPSAFNLKKGEAYYQNTWLFINSVHFGVTDNFSIGGGLELISTFTGEPIFFITPKYTFDHSKKFHTGVGLLYLSVPDFDGGRTHAGIGYGVATYGSKEHNITGGIGYGFIDSELARRPVFTLSGMTRIARKTAFVSENWLIPGEESTVGIYSYGLRFFGEKLAVDFAFVNNADIAREVLAIGIPFLGFTIKF